MPVAQKQGMQPLLILYATREGHTRNIAEHLAAAFRSHGLAVEVLPVAQDGGPQDLGRYAGVLIAASVHMARHEREIVSFVATHRAELARLPSAFLSVSMNQAAAEGASASAEERAKAAERVREAIELFFARTGWRPGRVKPVAGALLYRRYNFLLRFVMKRISRSEGVTTDTSRDHVFTDWGALDRFAEEFIAALPGLAAAGDRAVAPLSARS